ECNHFGSEIGRGVPAPLEESHYGEPGGAVEPTVVYVTLVAVADSLNEVAFRKVQTIHLAECRAKVDECVGHAPVVAGGNGKAPTGFQVFAASLVPEKDASGPNGVLCADVRRSRAETHAKLPRSATEGDRRLILSFKHVLVGDHAEHLGPFGAAILPDERKCLLRQSPSLGVAAPGHSN